MMDKMLIDFVLQYRKGLEAAINEERENRESQKVGGNGSGHCRISDPTAQKAIKHLDPVGTVKVYYGASINGVRDYRVIHDAEKWLSVANATWNYFSHGRYDRFMQLRYGDGLDVHGVRNAMKMGRSRFFYIQRDVREYAYRAAKGMHIVSADSYKHFDRTDDIVKALEKHDG